MATILPPKHSGLAQLADHAAANDGIERYPIKKKWEPRRLCPNWEAIRWLEDDTRPLCMIDYQQVDTANPELVVQYAVGRATRNYARPMFQVLPRDAFSGACLEVTPCTACDRWDRSWACEEHTELPYDHENKRWTRPSSWPESDLSENAPIVDIYERITTSPAWIEAERLSQARQIDPHVPCPCDGCRAAREEMTVRRPQPYYMVDGGLPVYSTPEVAVNPDADEMTLDDIRRYLALPNTEMNRSASFTLAVEGETIQGFAAFTIEVEAPDGTT